MNTSLPPEIKEMTGKEIRVVTWAAPTHIRFEIDRFQEAGGQWTKLYLDITLGTFKWFVRERVLDIGTPGSQNIGGDEHVEFDCFNKAYDHFSALKI